MQYNQYSSNFRMTRFGQGATILRARNGSPLSLDTIADKCPAVFAEDKHESRSAKYTFISTRELLEGMLREGFGVYEVRQGGSGDVAKRGFTKHMLRFRHASQCGEQGQYYATGKSEFGADAKVGDSVREICLINAHDGTSSYQAFGGWFRIACLNGLVSVDRSMEQVSIKIPHKGNVIQQVIEAAYTVIDQGKEQARMIEHMQAVPLQLNEQLAFAEAAAALRWDGEDQKAPITPVQVIEPKRSADVGNNLWLTFNRAQENLVRGGVHYTALRDVRNNAGDIVGRRMAHLTTRPVQAIEGDVKLNRALWILAERMAELKG